MLTTWSAFPCAVRSCVEGRKGVAQRLQEIGVGIDLGHVIVEATDGDVENTGSQIGRDDLGHGLQFARQHAGRILHGRLVIGGDGRQIVNTLLGIGACRTHHAEVVRTRLRAAGIHVAERIKNWIRGLTCYLEAKVRHRVDRSHRHARGLQSLGREWSQRDRGQRVPGVRQFSVEKAS